MNNKLSESTKTNHVHLTYLIFAGVLLFISVFMLHPVYANDELYEEVSATDNATINRQNIQSALNRAQEISNDSGQILHVLLKNGTYNLDGILNIYSNTILELESGATIIRSGDYSTSMLNTTFPESANGYNKAQNITVIGGTWDSNCKKNGSILHFSHSQNITIKNTTLKRCRGDHVVILDAVKNATLSKVTFLDDISDASHHSGNLRYVNEGIHIDSTPSGRPASDDVPLAEDGTPCENIIVDSCTFDGVCNAVGAHFHSKTDKYHSNITVTNNNFKRIESGSTVVTAAQSTGWKVKNNTAKNSGASIFARLNGCTNFEISNNVINNIDSFVVDNGNANGLKSNGTLSGNAVTGLRKNGLFSYQSNSTFTLKNEKYTTTRTDYTKATNDNFLILVEGKSWDKEPSHATIQDCTFTFTGTPKTSSSVSYLTPIKFACGKFIVKNNNISNSPGSGLYIKQAWSASTVENNKFSSCGSVRTGTDGYTVILESTNGITLKSNSLNSCKFGGIYLNGSSNNTITYNTITYPDTNSNYVHKGYPVLMYSKSNKNTVTNNTFNGNSDVKKSTDSTGNIIKSNKLNTTKPSWSGATKMPVNSTAAYSVKNGTIKVKSGGAYIGLSGNKVTAKKKGSAKLALINKSGKEVATRTIEVFDLKGEYIMQSSINSNYVLDIRGKSKNNSAQMIVWTKNGGKNQKYSFEKQTNGSYAIKCLHSGKYVDVQGGGTKKSQKVIQYTWKNGTNQKWKISVDSKNQVTFLNLKSGMAFDVRGGKAAKGKEMIQYPSNGGNNQKWVLKKP